MTSSGTINTLDTVAVGIGARKLKYQSIDQVRGLKVGDTVEYETNDKGWIDSIRRIDGDTRKDAPAMTPKNPSDEHTAAGVNQGGAVSSTSTPSTNSQSHADQDRPENSTAKVESQFSQHSDAELKSVDGPGLSPHDTPVQIILHRYEGNESRPDSVTYSDSTKWGGMKLYFDALKPEEFEGIIKNGCEFYSKLDEQIRKYRDQHPDLTNSGKEVKK